jgi:acylglycerol lipase
MRRLAGHFAGRGGLEIYWQSWRPPPPARAAVVIAHGAAEHSGRYAPLAARLVGAGFAVYALDHRGHGHSDGPRSLIDRLDRAVADLGHLVDQATADHDGRAPFLLGHSMGASLALDYALAAPPGRLAGLILSGPLVALDTPRPLLALSRLLARVAPRLGVYGVDAAAISRDPDQVRRYDDDPLVHRGKLPVRTVAELAGAIATFPRRAPDLALPLLIMQGLADRIVPPAGAKALAGRAGSKDKTLELYPDLYHEIFNEAEPERTAVLDDLVAWLQARAPAA